MDCALFWGLMKWIPRFSNVFNDTHGCGNTQVQIWSTTTTTSSTITTTTTITITTTTTTITTTTTTTMITQTIQVTTLFSNWNTPAQKSRKSYERFKLKLRKLWSSMATFTAFGAFSAIAAFAAFAAFTAFTAFTAFMAWIYTNELRRRSVRSLKRFADHPEYTLENKNNFRDLKNCFFPNLQLEGSPLQRRFGKLEKHLKSLVPGPKSVWKGK